MHSGTETFLSSMNGKPSKYKIGDKLQWKEFHSGEVTIVVLLSRYDRNSSHDTAWLVKGYPDGKYEFAVKERELSTLSEEQIQTLRNP